MRQPITIKRLEMNSIENMEPYEVAERVMSGEVIVIPECLQAIGYFEKLQLASLESIAQVTGQKRVRQIQQQGFEKFHHYINLDELTEIVKSAYKIHKSLSPMLAKTLARKILKVQKPFYYEESPNVRFHIPYDETIRKRQELNQFYWNGKVTAHGPHHDSWYHCPVNSLNVWIWSAPRILDQGYVRFPST